MHEQGIEHPEAVIYGLDIHEKDQVLCTADASDIALALAEYCNNVVVFTNSPDAKEHMKARVANLLASNDDFLEAYQPHTQFHEIFQMGRRNYFTELGRLESMRNNINGNLQVVQGNIFEVLHLYANANKLFIGTALFGEDKLDDRGCPQINHEHFRSRVFTLVDHLAPDTLIYATDSSGIDRRVNPYVCNTDIAMDHALVFDEQHSAVARKIDKFSSPGIYRRIRVNE